jgi:IS5 family transposase
MGQLGFFDLSRRYESLTEKHDPLAAIAAMVPFESFRPSQERSGTQEFGGTQALG